MTDVQTESGMEHGCLRDMVLVLCDSAPDNRFDGFSIIKPDTMPPPPYGFVVGIGPECVGVAVGDYVCCADSTGAGWRGQPVQDIVDGQPRELRYVQEERILFVCNPAEPLRATGANVVVEMGEIEVETRGGIVLPTTVQEDANEGRVASVGGASLSGLEPEDRVRFANTLVGDPVLHKGARYRVSDDYKHLLRLPDEGNHRRQ